MIAANMIRCGGFTTVAIAANASKPDIRALALAAGWNGSGAVVVDITAALINTLDLGATLFPGGLTINISAATRIGGVRGVNGAGTFALKTRVPVTINNLGTISGGGGAGGNGGACWVRYQTTSGTTNSSGGNAGTGQGFQDATSLIVASAVGGTSGATVTYSGAVLGGETKPWAKGGTGGVGGAWGASGSPGGSGTIGGSYAESYIAPPPAGSAAGPAVDGDPYVTWLNLGTIQGARI